jgi:hypothetical protein
MRVRRVGIRCRANRMLETESMLVQHDRDSPDQTVLLIAKQCADLGDRSEAAVRRPRGRDESHTTVRPRFGLRVAPISHALADSALGSNRFAASIRSSPPRPMRSATR